MPPVSGILVAAIPGVCTRATCPPSFPFFFLAVQVLPSSQPAGIDVASPFLMFFSNFLIFLTIVQFACSLGQLPPVVASWPFRPSLGLRDFDLETG